MKTHGKAVWRAVMVMVVGLVAGCGSGVPLPSFLGNSLTGSVANRADLKFDTVEIRRFPTGEIQVRYKRTSGGNNEIVAQVTVKTPTEGLTHGQDMDLLQNSGTVTRVIQDGQDFPPLKAGSIRFDTGGINDGEATRGKFSSTFNDDRTLNGSFDAKLTLANI